MEDLENLEDLKAKSQGGASIGGTALDRGFSLIECLVALLLMTTLMGFCYHSFQSFLMRHERARFLSSLKDALVFARSAAFFRHTTITLCGSHSHQKMSHA